jgi:hypothetical protein
MASGRPAPWVELMTIPQQMVDFHRAGSTRSPLAGGRFEPTYPGCEIAPDKAKSPPPQQG